MNDDDVQHLVYELVCFLVPTERSRFPDYERKTLLKHLRTVHRLAMGQSA
ncbi:MAG: hypothetical protein ACREF6_16985 [Alphaproteobacteria bacterium]